MKSLKHYILIIEIYLLIQIIMTINFVEQTVTI